MDATQERLDRKLGPKRNRMLSLDQGWGKQNTHLPQRGKGRGMFSNMPQPRIGGKGVFRLVLDDASDRTSPSQVMDRAQRNGLFKITSSHR